MDAGGIIEGLKRLGVPHDEIAAAINRDRSAATKMLAGNRSVKLGEVEALAKLITKYEAIRGDTELVRHARRLDEEFQEGLVSAYVAVPVLPTYGGMGGGGSGEGDEQMALLPRALVEDELRAKPTDLLVILARGNSMEPTFYQDDQILIDRRDKNVLQAGPFAIRYHGDEGWQIKNVERVPRTSRLRIWSQNAGFGDREEEAEFIEIAGRPVWYARRFGR